MPNCGNCGGYVTRDFVRVFGVDGTVSGCPHCTTYRELTTGGAVDDASGSRPVAPLGERRPP